MSIKGNIKIVVDQQDNVSIEIEVDDSNITVIPKGNNGKGTYKVKWEGGKATSDTNSSSFVLGKIGKHGDIELLKKKRYKFKAKIWCQKDGRLITRYRKLKSKSVQIKIHQNNDLSSPTLIYGIQQNGDLLLYKHKGYTQWEYGSRKVGNGWNSFLQVFAGGNGLIYAITSNNEMILYKHLGDAAYSFNPSGLNIGHGWNFKQVFANHKNYIFAIKQNGDMYLYKYNENNNNFNISGLKIGHGWNFKQVIIGENNLIFAIKQNGDMFLYKFNEDNNNFSISGEKIGNGWNFKQIITGNDNNIFAVKQNGDMFLYKFNEDNNNFSISGKKIGNGWNFEKIFSRIS